MNNTDPQGVLIFPAEIQKMVEQNEGDLPINTSDVFTRFLFFVANSTVKNSVPHTAKDVGVPSVTGPLDKYEFIPGYMTYVPLDEDAAPAPAGAENSAAKGAKIMSEILATPIVDDFRQWQDVETVEKVIADHFIGIQPEALELWTDVTSDATITNLAFQGLAAHLLSPVTGQGPAAFKVDLSSLSKTPVREGNELMGAIALFDANRNLLSIHVENDDTTYVPGDALWEHAKWHFRCAVFTYVTLVNHLAGLHMGVSEITMEATREALPDDHPLRRLLKPHVYLVGKTNTTVARVLGPEGGIGHRMWPFNFDGLVKLFEEGVETAPFEPFPRWLKNRGLANLSDEIYPFATDGLALYKICHDYVENYLAIYFSGESVVSDPAVQAWWKQLEATPLRSGLGTLQTKEQLIDLVAQIIYAVSGHHSHVGALTRYLADPRFMGSKVRVGSELSDMQSTFLTLSLNAVTGLPQPKLLDDFTHMFLELHKEQAVEVFQQFHESLVTLGREIDSRNETRKMPLRTFHPVVLDSSVSK